MDGLSFFTSSDVPKLLEELQHREDLGPDPESLGWRRWGDSYDWAPLTDPKLDPEYFDLLNRVDWKRAESLSSHSRWEYQHSGHNRETLIYTLKQYVIPLYGKPHLTTPGSASVVPDEERGS